MDLVRPITFVQVEGVDLVRQGTECFPSRTSRFGQTSGINTRSTIRFDQTLNKSC